MQTIEQGTLRGPLADQAAALFAWGSQWPLPAAAPVAPAWQPFLDAIGANTGGSYQAAGAPAAAPVAGARADRAVVLFSGGKDGLATALLLREAGISPALLHVTGINGPAYAHERDAAAAVARIAGLPLRVVAASLSGKSAHVENPVKNATLAALGAQAAAYWGAGVVALGVVGEDTQSANVHCGLSDNAAVIGAGMRSIEALATGLRFAMPQVAHECQSIGVVMRLCPDAMPAVSSCMAGARFKRSLHERNRAKFGVDLLPGRCGSCYKCAVEAVTLAAIAGQVLPLPFAAHCVKKMQRGAQVVTASAAPCSAADAIEIFGDADMPAWRAALGAAAP